MASLNAANDDLLGEASLCPTNRVPRLLATIRVFFFSPTDTRAFLRLVIIFNEVVSRSSGRHPWEHRQLSGNLKDARRPLETGTLKIEQTVIDRWRIGI